MKEEEEKNKRKRSLFVNKQMSKQTVAVVGSGLAGLTAAYYLQQSPGFEVHLFESSGSIGMDAGSLTVEGLRVDVPFRVVIPEYYPHLYRMYRHLGIGFSSADYSLAFIRQLSQVVWSYTNSLLAGGRMVSIPDAAVDGGGVGVARDWARIVYASLTEDGLEGVTVGEYMKQSQYGPVFADQVFLPFLSSLFTCSLTSTAQYPVATVLDFVRKAVLGSKIQKARNGVQDVCQYLTRGLAHIHLHTGVQSVRPADGGAGVLVEANGEELRFDQAVMATPADVAARLLENSGSDELLAALRSIPYEDALVVTHRDPQVMGPERQQWRGVNISTRQGHDLTMASHWINFVEDTSDKLIRQSLSSDLFQTVNPIIDIDPRKVVSATGFHRPMVTVESQRQLNQIHGCQGQQRIWLVGSYTAPGVPLLEGCVRTSLEVVEAMGGKVPFGVPLATRTREGKAYRVGLMPGMRRGEVVEAYYEEAPSRMSWALRAILVLLKSLSSLADLLLGPQLSRSLRHLCLTALVYVVLTFLNLFIHSTSK